MAYDPARTRVVLHAQVGRPTGVSVETWEWDGNTWAQRPHTIRPIARVGHAMAHDPVRDVTVLYGGLPDFADNVVWEWSGGSWRIAGPGAVSSAIAGHGMAYHEARGSMFLFGGEIGDPAVGATTLSGATREWSPGSGWTTVSSVQSPAPRRDLAMVFDRSAQRIVLFGGEGIGGALDDTWVFDGAWQRLSPQVRPQARFGHAMAYDSRRARLVLFGGTDGTIPLGDTWELAGAQWIQLAAAAAPSGPAARARHAMTYDPGRGRIVLFGGTGAQGDLADAWEWDGVQWQQRGSARAPAPRSGHAMAQDQSDGITVMFGGAAGGRPIPGATWEYAPVSPAEVEQFGSGCFGAPTILDLDARDFERPYTGTSVTLRLSGLDATMAAGILLGASDTQSGGVSLPFNLGAVGIPGCTLFVSGELFVPVVASLPPASVAQLTLAVPGDPLLVGRAFFAQALVVDNPPPFAPRVLVSNAVRATIGAP
jgi:hypothetical protein